MKINILKDPMAEMPYTEVEKLAQKGAVVREICPEFVGESVLADLEPTFLKGEEIGRWCMGEAEDKHLIPNGYVGDPAGSVYVKSRLRAVDEADRKGYQELDTNSLCAKDMCGNGEKMNYFIEGIQGAGKSTLLQKLSEKLPAAGVYREGDYSPVDLAWCAYVTEEQYAGILEKYAPIADEIKKNTVPEGAHKVISYTRVLTDIPGFHKDLEQYEIYNGNRDRAAFEQIVLQRFQNWEGENQIFECAFFQNIVENEMLFFCLSDEEIMDFYRRVRKALSAKRFTVLYLEVADIAEGIGTIRRERSDEAGNELWFPLMVRYLEESPYGKQNGLAGMEGLVAHLARRQALELRILRELFPQESRVMKAKGDEV